ncbi:MAG TPA: hydroxyacid dehydrogenase [Candidatus Sulfotelmatobacter sp.]|nr:hydroxyacid dehydrogenase [Candidatus Sulfotelmatobacter sp.]
MAPNRKKLLITEALGRSGRDILAARDDIEVVAFANMIAAADFLALLQSSGEVHGVALGGTRFGEAEIAAARGLQVVARIGVGYDAVDVPALSRRRVPLMVTGIANSPSVAEQALFFMMALAKRGAALHALVQEGRWGDRFVTTPGDLLGKTVLIVGFGRIGTRTARRCLAMEMTVLVYDPYVPAAAIRAAGCEPVADLDAALPQADFVTLHCPKTPETVGLFGAARLRKLRPTAFLVNTARGGIVDEPALHAALTGGVLAGAALDVFEREPPPTDNPLLTLPNVITSPHLAGVTAEAIQRMAVATARNMLSAIDGQPIRENVVNREIFG